MEYKFKDGHARGWKGNVDDDYTWKPTTFFFYGSLTIHKILKSVLKLSKDPILQPAKTYKMRLKMFGPLPALLEMDSINTSQNRAVYGVAFNVETKEQFEKLAAYEGELYKDDSVLLKFLDDEGMKMGATGGRALFWAGDESVLPEGEFDKEAFVRLLENEGF